MRKLVLTLLLSLLAQGAAARQIDPQFLGLFDRKCGKTMLEGNSLGSSTAISLGVYKVFAFPHASISFKFNRGDEWNLGTTDVVEVCFNPANEQSGEFRVTWYAPWAATITNVFIFASGQRAGEGVANEDAKGINFVLNSTANIWYTTELSYYATFEPGDCYAPMFAGFQAGNMQINSWWMTMEQLNCYDEDW